MAAIPLCLSRLSGLAVLSAALAGCGGARPGPHLTAEWVGADTGSFNARATAAWCPVARRLEVQATKNDMAFGVVVYPDSVIVPGAYPVFDPGVDTAHRPGAAGAARWFTDQLVAGFQSDSGTVEVLEAGKSVRLRFSFRLRSLTGEDTIRAEGEAARLAPGGCPGDSVPNSQPAQ